MNENHIDFIYGLRQHTRPVHVVHCIYNIIDGESKTQLRFFVSHFGFFSCQCGVRYVFVFDIANGLCFVIFSRVIIKFIVL